MRQSTQGQITAFLILGLLLFIFITMFFAFVKIEAKSRLKPKLDLDEVIHYTPEPIPESPPPRTPQQQEEGRDCRTGRPGVQCR